MFCSVVSKNICIIRINCIILHRRQQALVFIQVQDWSTQQTKITEHNFKKLAKMKTYLFLDELILLNVLELHKIWSFYFMYLRKITTSTTDTEKHSVPGTLEEWGKPSTRTQSWRTPWVNIASSNQTNNAAWSCLSVPRLTSKQGEGWIYEEKAGESISLFNICLGLKKNPVISFIIMRGRAPHANPSTTPWS